MVNDPVSVFTRRANGALPKLPRNALPRGRVGYLDIETTGLDPASAHVTLVGLAWPHGQGRQLRQYFVGRPRLESATLQVLAADLESFAGVVTYNGTLFDLPFLRWRARIHGIRWPWIETLDLLWVARAWRKAHGRLPDCRLRSVMSHFRVGRTDETSGEEMIRAYRRWRRTADVVHRDQLLEHNAQDVLLLPDVVPHLLPAARARP